MNMLISIVAGALIGVVLGRVRVPRTDWLSILSLAVVVIGCWWAIIVSLDDVSAGDGVAFVVVSQISASLYAAWLWQRSGVIALSFLQLAWWSFWRPRYVEQLGTRAVREHPDDHSSVTSTSP